MSEVKKELKKEVIEQIKRIIILILSLALILKGYSIAGFFKGIDNEKVKWTLDFGMFNILIGIVITAICYLINSRKMTILIKLTDLKNKSDSINLNKSTGKVKIDLKITGNSKKNYPKINIEFPSWVDIQLKKKTYLEIDYANSNIEIDITSLVKNKKELDIDETITIDLISSSDEKGSIDFSNCYLEKGKFSITLDKSEIKIMNG